MPYEITLPDGYVISDDMARLDIDTIHTFISTESYWAIGRPRALMEASIAGSLCLGLYAPDGAQVGFLRLVTDRAIIAHLNDVFVLPLHRGNGHGTALVQAILDHPELVTVRRWSLSTHDAHTFYAKFGFAVHADPQNQMVFRRT